MTTADLIGKIVQLVAGIAVFAAVVGLILFFIDRAPKRGRDVLQLLAFLLPALILLGIGLVYPAIRTAIAMRQQAA
jgi:alpha-glucoside transport system permease protein